MVGASSPWSARLIVHLLYEVRDAELTLIEDLESRRRPGGQPATRDSHARLVDAFRRDEHGRAALAQAMFDSLGGETRRTTLSDFGVLEPPIEQAGNPTSWVPMVIQAKKASDAHRRDGQGGLPRRRERGELLLQDVLRRTRAPD